MLGGQIRSPKDFEEGDFRSFAPRFSEENFPKNLKLVDQLTEIAKRKGTTSSQLTLAWYAYLHWRISSEKHCTRLTRA